MKLALQVAAAFTILAEPAGRLLAAPRSRYTAPGVPNAAVFTLLAKTQTGPGRKNTMPKLRIALVLVCLLALSACSLNDFNCDELFVQLEDGWRPTGKPLRDFSSFVVAFQKEGQETYVIVGFAEKDIYDMDTLIRQTEEKLAETPTTVMKRVSMEGNKMRYAGTQRDQPAESISVLDPSTGKVGTLGMLGDLQEAMRFAQKIRVKDPALAFF